MLPPVTEEEKAKYTLRLQFEKAVEELLSEAYEAGYNGYLDIWPEIKTNKNNNQLIMTVRSKKIVNVASESSHQEVVRYHILPGKGCKKIKLFDK